MRNREREITLLYGMSLIRDDILSRPVPAPSLKGRALIAAHLLVNFAVLLACLIIPPAVLLMTLILHTG